ncbi:MFS transporter [Streptomyces sp. WMMB 322]|uniref:MFS transporter n=1 Tax=Streptomyces sp. WMMB 322 TaxID=1286821 RepID=UPI000823F817|nr:MFS transporter [Streptomyces sp. WMMB 322]SCK12958.1 drug resistance transporter, EmrB/QacA subfamily [Streptomyces sp. WMMB 322]
MATTTPSGVQGAGSGGGVGDASQNHASASSGPGGAAPMTHRQIMEALSGLLLGMFVAILSSTIVANALPKIVSDLGGGQSSYTWVVTASLLTMTASTPLWGKLADLFSKKALIQTAIVVFVLASASAGLAQDTSMLIASRAVQGIGMGGISALTQTVIAAMISPRQRGRYTGYIGASFAVAMVSGPLLGGVITDTDWLGWRWCFYAGIPFAVIALLLLQKTLHLPVIKRKVKIDWAGALLVASAASLLLVWVTFAGDKYAWLSWESYAMVGGSLALTLLFVLVESRAKEPIIPLRLFRNRTIALTSLASMFVGIAMFGATVYLSQYFQLARGESPTMAGVMTIPMILGMFLSTTLSGLVISRTGKWKIWLCSGGVLLTAGLGLLGTMRHDTEYWHLALYMGGVGVGVGMMMQNLVLATQNQVEATDLGAASSSVNFFRSLGGAVGVSVLGAVLAHRISDYVDDGLDRLGVQHGGPTGGAGSEIPDLAKLPAPVRDVIESAYGHGIGDIYLYAAPVALLGLLLVLCVKEVPLKTKPGMSHGESATGELLQQDAAFAGGAAPQGDAGDFIPPGYQPAEPGPTDADEPLAGTPHCVLGTVRNAEGKGVPRAAVTLISLSGRQLGRSVARADGRYGMDTPGPGTYVLIAAADGHQPQATTLTVGDEPLSHDVLLAATSGLAGRVRGSGDGQPVRSAMVVVTDERGEVLATGRTGERGEFAFDELVTGTFTLAVNAPGFRPVARPVDIEGQGITRIDVELQAGARVQGVIRAGVDASPLADARVTLVDAAGNVVATATTGEDGAYGFTDLDAGEYSIIASGYPPVASALSVDGSGPDSHDIELHHPDE